MAPLNSPDDPGETGLGRNRSCVGSLKWGWLCLTQMLSEKQDPHLKNKVTMWYGFQVFTVYCLDFWKWRQRQWLSAITCSQKEQKRICFQKYSLYKHGHSVMVQSPSHEKSWFVSVSEIFKGVKSKWCLVLRETFPWFNIKEGCRILRYRFVSGWDQLFLF